MKKRYEMWVYFDPDEDLEERIRAVAKELKGEHTGSGTKLTSPVRRDNSFEFRSRSARARFAARVRRWVLSKKRKLVAVSRWTAGSGRPLV